MLKGVVVILAFWLIAAYFHMSTILWIGENMIGFVVTAIVVVLQPELRKALETLGNKDIIPTNFFMGTKQTEAAFSEKTIGEIVKACTEMGKCRTGALIVVECKQPLGDFERTGIDVDALVSSQLLINIFEHNTPLHDGAVIVRGNRVTSATCYLPLSDNMNISKDLGTRHRAALGISESSDSITVVVSEETGRVTLAQGGTLTRMNDPELLRAALSPKKTEEAATGRFKLWKGRQKNEGKTE